MPLAIGEGHRDGHCRARLRADLQESQRAAHARWAAVSPVAVVRRRWRRRPVAGAAPAAPASISTVIPTVPMTPVGILGELTSGHRRGACHSRAGTECGKAERPCDGGTRCDGLKTLHCEPLITLVSINFRLRSTPTWLKVIAGHQTRASLPTSGFRVSRYARVHVRTLCRTYVSGLAIPREPNPPGPPASLAGQTARQRYVVRSFRVVGNCMGPQSEGSATDAR
jgi:hypothetical protein